MLAASPATNRRVDWAGVMHAPAGPDARIASLVPSLTELLFALGLGSRVVARTGFCCHPKPAVLQVPKIGGTKDPDIDALRALAPTHLIVNVDENRREVVDRTRAFVPHVIVTHPALPEDNPRLYRLFGAIFGAPEMAEGFASAFLRALAELERVAHELPRERVLYLIWRKPWMTVARDTYVSATLARAGLDTVPARATDRYPIVNDDDIAWTEAERILVSSEPYAFRARDADAIGRERGRPASLIDGEWTSWYGTRAIAGLAALAQWRSSTA